jgi:hypothetical protein
MEVVCLAMQNKLETLVDGITSNANSSAFYKANLYSYFQAKVVGTGAVTATIAIEGSNNSTDWSSTALATITLSGTTSKVDGATVITSCKYVRAAVTNITGTGAAVTVTMAN